MQVLGNSDHPGGQIANRGGLADKMAMEVIDAIPSGQLRQADALVETAETYWIQEPVDAEGTPEDGQVPERETRHAPKMGYQNPTNPACQGCVESASGPTTALF